MITICLISCFHTFGQPYVEGGNTRHRFAQLNLGIDFRSFSNNGTKTFVFNQNNELEEMKLASFSETRMIIGGTHFWGHADFFVAIPITNFGNSGFITGVETGSKFFPWRIKNNKISPYIGISWMPVGYKQNEGTSLYRNKFPITSGLVFNHKNHLVEINFGKILNSNFQYYINTHQEVNIKTHSIWYGFTYKLMLETTLGAEKNWLNGKTEYLTDTLSKLKKLNGFTLAIGPSTSIFLKNSDHNNINYPFLDDYKFSSLFMDYGLGYYLHHPDIQFNITFRNIKSEINAYDYNQKVSRKSLGLECYKFLGDYHGFVPFLGLTFSHEWLNASTFFETEQLSNVKTQKIHPGLVFGWDIRPDRLQVFYLRTNLRWSPLLNLEVQNNQFINFNQLEFNFIQLVIFPSRIF